MPTPMVLDPEPLVLAISEDEPAGRPLSIMERGKLKEQSVDFDPARDLTEEDRKDPKNAEAKRVLPKWDKILEFGSDFLATQGKDLRAAFAMVEAATKRYEFAGTRDGLKLLRRLCEDCWEHLHPVIEDPENTEDVEARTNLFSFVDEELKIPYFPNAVRGIALMEVTTADGARVPVNYLNCQPPAGSSAPPAVSQAEFRAAVMTAADEQVAGIRVMDEDLTEALQELDGLAIVLDRKAGSAAPGFSGLRKALNDCLSMTQEVLRLRGGGAPAEDDADGSAAPDRYTGGGLAPNSGGGFGGLNFEGNGAPSGPTRDQLYRYLLQVTEALERLEPHSPVPFLVRRAVEMQSLSFPTLVDQLTAAKPLLDFIRQPIEAGESNSSGGD